MVQNATVPVIETGIGVCHTYVDVGADYDMARAIAINAKVQRPAVCNAMETLLVHEDAAAEFLPQMLTEYFAAGVTIIGCGKTQALINESRQLQKQTGPKSTEICVYQ